MMKDNIYLLLGLFLILFMPVIIAAPPITSINTAEGITIEIPFREAHILGQDYKFHLHAYNSSNGKRLTNSSTSCLIHLYDFNGSHILEAPMGFNSNLIDFEFLALASNFYKVGTYEVLFECQAADIGGFSMYSFLVNTYGEILETKDSILNIGILFFIFILSLIFVVSGGGMLRVGGSVMWGGFLLLGVGGVILYGATFLANNFIIAASNTMGGAEVVSGFFLFFARMLKYSPYLVIAMVLYFIIKWRKSIKDSHDFGDGWDNNNY